MSDGPQLENGYTRFANEWLEALIGSSYPASVIRFTLAVARLTWGYQRGGREAPWTEITTGRLASLLGISQSRISRIRKLAIEANLIEFAPGEQWEIPGYRVQKHTDRWRGHTAQQGSYSEQRSSEPRCSDVGVAAAEEVVAPAEDATQNSVVTKNDAVPTPYEQRRSDIKERKEKKIRGYAPAPDEASYEEQLEAIRAGVSAHDLWLVDEFVENAAGENKSGKITKSRTLNLNRELLELAEEVGMEAWRYGMNEANKRSVPNPNYVKKAAGGHAEREPTAGQPRRLIPQAPSSFDHLKLDEFGQIIEEEE